MIPKPGYRVEVRRADFVESLRRVKKFLRRTETADAIVTMEGKDLSVTFIGATIFFPSIGTWAGEVRVPATLFYLSAAKPPAEDPVVIHVLEDRLHVGPVSMKCVRQNAWRSEILLPLDASIPDVLRVRLMHPKERITRAGLERRIEQAEAEVRKKFARALPHLQGLEITETDLWQLLETCIARRVKPSD